MTKKNLNFSLVVTHILFISSLNFEVVYSFRLQESQKYKNMDQRLKRIQLSERQQKLEFFKNFFRL